MTLLADVLMALVIVVASGHAGWAGALTVQAWRGKVEA